MAGDDHKHHASGHDGDADGLDGQVKNIARRQKTSVGQHVKDQAHQNKGTDHAQQACVDLELGQERTFGGCR